MIREITPHQMDGFDPQWLSPEDYILGITEHIWERRGIDDLRRLYSPDIVVRTPAGFSDSNEAVAEGTRATLREFPDRELLGEDVIWCDDGEGGFLSSHRIISTATHTGDGVFGPATGKRLVFRTIADCAAKRNVIYDEWLVRDVGAIVRQLGWTPQSYAAERIRAQQGTIDDLRPMTPATSPAAVYRNPGNDHPAGGRYAELLTSAVGGLVSEVEAGWDRAIQIDTPGHRTGYGRAAVAQFWAELRTALPDAELRIEHHVGSTDAALGDRAALRWWLSGSHDGPGIFDDPTGAPVHIMGISHAEFGPRGIRREWIVFDEVATWTQILLDRDHHE